jgi:hypothetical protein
LAYNQLELVGRPGPEGIRTCLHQRFEQLVPCGLTNFVKWRKSNTAEHYIKPHETYMTLHVSGMGTQAMKDGGLTNPILKHNLYG